KVLDVKPRGLSVCNRMPLPRSRRIIWLAFENRSASFRLFVEICSDFIRPLFGCCSGSVRVLFGCHPKNTRRTPEEHPKDYRSCPEPVPKRTRRKSEESPNSTRRNKVFFRSIFR